MEKIRKIFEILTGKNDENEMQQEIEENKRCENCERLSKIIEELKKQIDRNNQEFEFKINEANTKIEVLEGTIKGLLAKRFGQSSEKSKYITPEEESQSDETSEDIDNHEDEVGERRKRGGQKGQKGHGRRLPINIPQIEYIYKLEEDDCKCPICGKKYRLIPKFQRESHEIEIKIEIIMNVHKQCVYEKECNCDMNVPELIVAKKPENIIYKSVFSTSSWCKMLGLKYLTGIPVNRFNQLFTDGGYEISPSTVIGGFKKIHECVKPLYDKIIEYNQSESHWHCDETSWCRILDEETKTRRLYWVWVFVGKRSVVYVMDPTRTKNVPEKHFKNTKSGIVSVDRYASYNILSDKLILSYCWYHLRRDFISLFKKYKPMKDWVFKWLKRIREIEKLNNKRVVLYYKDDSFEDIQAELETKVMNFFIEALSELNNTTLKDVQIKVLSGMIKRQAGYSVFLEYPEIPMDNTRAEREFRHVAFARNNYNGSKSKWGGEFAAIMWTIFKTAQINGLDPIAYLQYYLIQYSINNKIPENLQELLPWNCKESSILSQKDTG